MQVFLLRRGTVTPFRAYLISGAISRSFLLRCLSYLAPVSPSLKLIAPTLIPRDEATRLDSARAKTPLNTFFIANDH